MTDLSTLDSSLAQQNNMVQPFFSILIPTYNRGRTTLARAIDSALKQTFEDIEIVVVDDGSSDNTEDLVCSYRDPRIKYIKHETNQGITTSRNTCFDNANGKWLLFLDSDDELYPHACERFASVILMNPQVNWVMGHMLNYQTGDVCCERFPEGVITHSRMMKPHRGTCESFYTVKAETLGDERFIPGLNCFEGELIVRLLPKLQRYMMDDTVAIYHTDNEDRITLTRNESDESMSEYAQWTRLLDARPNYLIERIERGLPSNLAKMLQLFYENGDRKRAQSILDQAFESSLSEEDLFPNGRPAWTNPVSDQEIFEPISQKMKRLIVRGLRALHLYPPAPQVYDTNPYSTRPKGNSNVVLILSPSIGNDTSLGLTNYFISWLEGFRLNGMDAYLFAYSQSLKPTKLPDDLNDNQVLAPYKGEPSGIEGIKEVIMRLSPQLVITPPMPRQSFASFARELKDWGIPCLLLSSGESPYVTIPDESARLNLVNSINETIDGVVVVSKHLKDTWIELGCDEKKLFVTVTPVRTALFLPYDDSKTIKNSAVYIGNLAHDEIDNLFEIAELVRRAIPEFVITVYADAHEDTIEAFRTRVRNSGLEGCICFHSSLPSNEVYDRMRHAQVLLLPRASGEFSSAGFPNKLGEYLASGAPVVVTSVGSIGKLLSNHTHAYIVDPDDNEQFAESVIHALTDRREACEIGKNGRDFIFDRAECGHVASTLVSWVRRLLDESDSAQGTV